MRLKCSTCCIRKRQQARHGVSQFDTRILVKLSTPFLSEPDELANPKIFDKKFDNQSETFR